MKQKQKKKILSNNYVCQATNSSSVNPVSWQSSLIVSLFNGSILGKLCFDDFEPIYI